MSVLQNSEENGSEPGWFREWHMFKRLAGAGNTGLLSAKHQPRDSLIPGLR